jgi:hypothetical protein
MGLGKSIPIYDSPVRSSVKRQIFHFLDVGLDTSLVLDLTLSFFILSIFFSIDFLGTRQHNAVRARPNPARFLACPNFG